MVGTIASLATSFASNYGEVAAGSEGIVFHSQGYVLSGEYTSNGLVEDVIAAAQVVKPGADLSNVQVFTSPDLDSVSGVLTHRIEAGLTINKNTILLNTRFERTLEGFGTPYEIRDFVYRFAHELGHIVQFRTVPLFIWRYQFASGYYEAQATSFGNAVSNYIFQK